MNIADPGIKRLLETNTAESEPLFDNCRMRQGLTLQCNRPPARAGGSPWPPLTRGTPEGSAPLGARLPKGGYRPTKHLLSKNSSWFVIVDDFGFGEVPP
jgi:hypothetical protein